MGRKPTLINHARTLLLNEAGEHLPDGSPYDAYIPDYLPLRQDSTATVVRNMLFRKATTSQQKRARVSAMISLVYASGLGEWLDALDPRATYTPSTKLETRERSHAEAMISAPGDIPPSVEYKLWDVQEWFLPRDLLLKHRAAGPSSMHRAAAFILLYLNYLTWQYRRRELALGSNEVEKTNGTPESVIMGWDREIDWDTILDWDEVL